MRATEHCYIVTDEQILNGEPIIKGTRTPVRAIVETWRLGLAEEIPSHLPHLTLAQVFDGLSYYSDHQAEIDTILTATGFPTRCLIHWSRTYGRLFIELYLDEDVDVLMASSCVRAGSRRHHTGSRELHNNDAEQLAYAVSQHKTLLTHNRVDFEALAQTYFAAGQPHDGSIIAVRRPPGHYTASPAYSQRCDRRGHAQSSALHLRGKPRVSPCRWGPTNKD